MFILYIPKLDSFLGFHHRAVAISCRIILFAFASLTAYPRLSCEVLVLRSEGLLRSIGKERPMFCQGTPCGSQSAAAGAGDYSGF